MLIQITQTKRGEGAKEEAQNNNLSTENITLNTIYPQGGSQTITPNVAAQRGALAIINEIDDRKNKKKKAVVPNPIKKKPK